MILFENTKTQISPCIVSKVRFALGLKKDEPTNNKICSNEYWHKAVNSVSKQYAVNDDAKIKNALNLFSKIVKRKHLTSIVFSLVAISCSKQESSAKIVRQGDVETVCYYEKKKANMTITYQEMADGEKKFGNHTTWSSQCCKADDKYYATEVLGVPDEWYEAGKVCK